MYRGMSWEAMRVRSIHLRETEITDMAAKHFETFRLKYSNIQLLNIFKHFVSQKYVNIWLPNIFKHFVSQKDTNIWLPTIVKAKSTKVLFLFLLRIVLSPKHTGVILPGPIWINPVT